MMQLKKPDDFVIATGKQYSVREFVNIAAKYLEMNIKWIGKGVNERGIDKKTGKIINGKLLQNKMLKTWTYGKN